MVLKAIKHITVKASKLATDKPAKRQEVIDKQGEQVEEQIEFIQEGSGG
jgi:hypothetical protein